MADMPFTVPQLYAHAVTNRPEMLGGELGIPDGSNTFNRHTFVVQTTGALVALASGAVLSCGFCLDASKATTAIDPPTQFFGDRHFPVSLRGQRFAISVTDATGHYGEANGAPQLSEVTIGEMYGILKLADGNHALNVDNTTNDFFVVVEKLSQWQGQAQVAATYNPVVVVEVIAAARQDI